MDSFTVFSLEHFYNILGYSILTGVLFLLANIFGNKFIAKSSAFGILVIKLLETYYRYVVLNEPFINLLPLHICNFTLIIAILVMFFKSYRLFEIMYFWSIGAIFALLTPEVRLSFPNPWNFTFFTTHFYLLFATIFCVTIWEFKPTKKSLIKSIIYLNLIFAIVFFINSKLGTNYMFVNYKPEFSSPIDFLGPWPYYIISIEIIGFILFYLAYLPFRNKKPKFSNRF